MSNTVTVDDIEAGLDAFLDIKFHAEDHEMLPNAAVLIHGSWDRYCTNSQYLLLAPLPDLIPAHGLESLMFFDVGVGGIEEAQWHWLGVRKLPRKPPSYWSPIPGGLHIEVNRRFMSADDPSANLFQQEVYVFDKGLKLHAAHCMSHKPPHHIKMSRRMAARGMKLGSEWAYVVASLYEDVERKGVMAAIADAGNARVAVAVPFGEHKEVFALRDAPLTPKGRRRAILHWVSEHMRHRAEAVSVIPKHLRGVREIQVDDMHVRLVPNL